MNFCASRDQVSNWSSINARRNESGRWQCTSAGPTEEERRSPGSLREDSAQLDSLNARNRELEELATQRGRALAETRQSLEQAEARLTELNTAQAAKTEIGLERARAIEELKATTVELTLEASSRLLGRELHDADHQRLAQSTIDELFAREVAGSQ